MDPFHYISIPKLEVLIFVYIRVPPPRSSPRGLLPLFVVFSFQSPWTLTLVCCLFFPVPVDSYPCLLALLYSPRGLLPLFVGFALQSPFGLLRGLLPLFVGFSFESPSRLLRGLLPFSLGAVQSSWWRT